MRNTISTILFLCALSSCTNQPKEIEQVKGTTQTKNKKPGHYSSQSKLRFGDPQQIDSSVYVMYPLEMKHSDRSFIKSSAGEEYAYDWNIIFLNTEKQKYHLLDSNRKMLIRAYNIDQSSMNDVLVNGRRSYDKRLYYSVITTDLNKDGQLDGDDPEYLFTSDVDGSNFRQISPDNFDVRSWKVIRETNKVLISAVYMSPGGKRDSDNDETTPFIYDLKTGSLSHQIFDVKFIEKTKTLFDEGWPEKK